MELQPTNQDALKNSDKRQFGNRFLTEKEDVFTHNACTVVDLENTRNRKKPQFGNRHLIPNTNPFQFNAWDNVEWDEEQEEKAKEAVERNAKDKISIEKRENFENYADKFWNDFYGIHQNRFFKDRHWLFTEFPELAPKKESINDNENRCIFEIGCGVGNTILPILKYSQESNLKIYGCDFSSKAIEILKNQEEFDSQRCNVFVMDATNEHWIVPFEENTLDIIVLIFVLSAIKPDKMKIVAKNCFKYLKSGGLLLFRDYGRYDMAQLRFKSGKCLQDNFYVRGDGTMVYFFQQEEIRDLFENVGFHEEQNFVDRRLQVNRSRLLKMYRVWIQKKYRKPI